MLDRGTEGAGKEAVLEMECHTRLGFLLKSMDNVVFKIQSNFPQNMTGNLAGFLWEIQEDENRCFMKTK